MVKGASYSEVDAMRDVDGALGKLEADAQQRVMDWAASKYHQQEKTEAKANSGGRPDGEQKTPPPTGDIKAFMAQKRPDGYPERIACLVYYLEKSEGRADVGTNDITKANSDARLSKLTNPAVFVKYATHNYGYLTSLGKRKFAISLRGEAVVDALPDRAQVEEAHNKFPFGTKANKRGKKTRPKK